jgi:hypothetical protein
MQPINLTHLSNLIIFNGNAYTNIFDVLILLLLTYLLYRLSSSFYRFFKKISGNRCQFVLSPRFSDKPIDSSNLLRAIHGLDGRKTVIEKFFKLTNTFSLEIIADSVSGIQYMLGAPAVLETELKQMILAQFPDLTIKQKTIKHIKHNTAIITCFKLNGKSYFPLNINSYKKEDDPLKYLLTNFSELKKDDSVSLQILIVKLPGKANLRLSRRFKRDRTVKKSDRSHSLVAMIFIRFPMFIVSNLSSVLNRNQNIDHYESGLIDNLATQEVFKKLSDQLFSVSLRIQVNIQNKNIASAKVNGLQAAMDIYANPPYQSLVSKHHFFNKLADFCYDNNLLSLLKTSQLIMSVQEITSIYHFPEVVDALALGVSNGPSKFLNLTPSLQNRQGPGIFIGDNLSTKNNTPIKILKDERQRHMYILGGTGTGKTTLMKNSILQDINNNEGLAVIDPHGDMAEDLIRLIPAKRIKDVIYLNPADISRPIGINIMELNYDLPESELVVERDFVTEAIVSLLRKIFTEDEIVGHRIEYILRNAIHTAFTTYRPNIFTVYRLLNDYSYRKQVVATLKDYDLRNFWISEFGQAGGMQRVKMSAGVTAKIGRFLRSESARRMLEQRRSTIDFDDILRSRKILICNLSKGKIGEDTSNLIGLCVLTKLQLSAYKRQYLPKSKRRDFFIYVDEFQNFATKPFVQLLSESRKYGLCMTLAEQSLSQQSNQSYISTILANIGCLITFRSNSPMDESIILPLFEPYLSKGDLRNLPSYKYYARLSALNVYEPFSGQVAPQRNIGAKSTALKVINSSRKNYTKIILINHMRRPS